MKKQKGVCIFFPNDYELYNLKNNIYSFKKD
jgi:hypothetical protein